METLEDEPYNLDGDISLQTIAGVRYYDKSCSLLEIDPWGLRFTFKKILSPIKSLRSVYGDSACSLVFYSETWFLRAT